jgi:valyl-tRNA synthetase
MKQVDKSLTVYTIPVYTDTNKKSFTDSYKSFVDDYGSDALRLACLDESSLDSVNLEKYNHMIQKFWNAARYIYMNYSIKDTLSLEDLSSYVEKNFHQLTEFDQWMLYRLSELDKKLSTHNEKDLQFISSYVIATIIDDICIKYVEVIKTTANNHTPYVLRFVIASACVFLYPFVPFVTEVLWSLY